VQQRSLTVPDTANALLQNRINISIIFNYLRDHAGSHRAKIARDLGISAPAVSRAVDKLLKDEYVIESEKAKLANGKRAAQIQINAERGFIVGVDLLSDPMRLAISDFEGVVHDSWIAPPGGDVATFPDHLVSTIESCLRTFKDKSARPNLRILAIGIGVPAIVDPRTGAILNASLYDRISDSNIHDRMSEHFGIPVFIENTANLAAIGEWKRGVGRNAANLVFLEISNGIGAGIILDGDLHRGAQGAAGEIGYFITDVAGLGYDSSKIGYLESRASLEAFQLFCGPTAGDFAGRPASVSSLFEAAAAGSDDALRVIQEAVKHLAVAVVDTILLLNPEIVILGGEVCELPEAYALLLKPLMDEVRANYHFSPTDIRLASLGANASLIGAVQFALDSLIVHTYPYRL
jgi:predicted NBD/HSP70 family sugar kinase